MAHIINNNPHARDEPSTMLDSLIKDKNRTFNSPEIRQKSTKDTPPEKKERDDFSFDLNNLYRRSEEIQESLSAEQEQHQGQQPDELKNLSQHDRLSFEDFLTKGYLTISDIVQSNPSDLRLMNMRVGELIDTSTGRTQYLTGHQLTRYEVLHSAEGLLGKVGPERNSNFRTTTLGEIRGEPVLGNNIYNSQMLELIGKGESGGDYNRVFGKAKRIDLTNMTINDVIAWQKNYTSVEGSASSAAGKYQFIRKTLQATADNMGLSGNEKFDAKMQDRMAMHLLNETGYAAMLAGKMNEGKFVNRVAGVWASLEGTNGRGVYDGDGLNAGKISAGTTLAAAHMDKMILSNPDGATAVAALGPTSANKQKPDTAVAAVRPIKGPEPTPA